MYDDSNQKVNSDLHRYKIAEVDYEMFITESQPNFIKKRDWKQECLSQVTVIAFILDSER